MKRIGLTGNIGTGKSTMVGMLSERGVPTIDADTIAHQVIAPHTHAWKKIFERYGKSILLVDGLIDRTQLAQIVFADPHEHTFLEDLLHPVVRAEMERQFSVWKHAGQRYGVVEVQLLFEAKWETAFDLIVVVSCDSKTQLQRCQKKWGWSEDDVMQRLKHQWPLEKKIAGAHQVIDNAGTLDETRVQVDRLWRAWERGDFSSSKKEMHA